jgi:hypothetical protein
MSQGSCLRRNPELQAGGLNQLVRAEVAQAMRCASVIPFPQACRRPFICRIAARVTSVSAKTGEKLLVAAVRQQFEVMARKGISADLIERECRKLECAIRAEICKRVLLPDDVA